MGIIKKFKDYFKPKSELDENDVELIKDIFTNLFDDLDSNYNLENGTDFEFNVRLKDKYTIEGSIHIDPSHELHLILDSNEMKETRNHIKSLYKLSDTIDKIDKLRKSSGGMSIGPDAELLIIDMTGIYEFKITSK
jgi:hypothetical protein